MQPEDQEQLRLKFEFEKAKAARGVGVGRPSDQINFSNPQNTNAVQAPNANSFMAGAKPGIADYAPAFGVVKDAATGSHDSLGSGYSDIKSRPQNEQDMIIHGIESLPPGLKSQVLKELFKLNYQRDIEKNKSDRSAAQQADPVGYGMGQATSGALLGAGAGMAAGPGIAAQGLAGMASGFAMDPSAKSALAGGAAGAGSFVLPKAIGAGIRKSGNALADTTITDDMIADWINMDSAERLNAKSGGEGPSMDEIADVVRANAKAGGSPQAVRENIELSAVKRGAEGTYKAPLQTYPKQVDLQAEFAPQKPQKSWLKPSGKSREIDLGEPTPHDQTLADYNGTGLYENASTDDINNMMPSHPGADAALAPRGSVNPNQYGKSGTLSAYDLGPTTPPLSPAERYVSEKLGGVTDRGLDLVHQTPSGAVNRLLANRLAPAAGLAAPELGKRMLSMLDNVGAGMGIGAINGAAASALKKKIQAVISSDDPALYDYIAKEEDPMYRALSMEAADAAKKESK